VRHSEISVKSEISCPLRAFGGIGAWEGGSNRAALADEVMAMREQTREPLDKKEGGMKRPFTLHRQEISGAARRME
jgi:hypothetical protein